jgi:site-specific DNA-methyltransferase (adenine-specific)
VSLEYRVGDVRDRLAEIPDGSIDLIVTSPPFLALRSYLPADHEHKAKEIGSEATPAAFIDTLLALTAEFGRVLAPHGSICVELGDTYAGSGPGSNTGSGISESRQRARFAGTGPCSAIGPGWPLAKSLTGIPTLYPWSLAYGRNLLTGAESPAGRWRIRNVIVWARPNPPVGALGDKFRPATSYITVACKGPRRFFDLDAVRGPGSPNTHARLAAGVESRPNDTKVPPNGSNRDTLAIIEGDGGAPPLDWHTDNHPEDGDWLWKLSTQPYRGSHYATFPLELPTRLIMAMCPLRVCTGCGRPSERIVEQNGTPYPHDYHQGRNGGEATGGVGGHVAVRNVTTLGWSDCGHDAWRTGVTLDPFGGSGTVAQAAQNVGRHAILIDLDHRNADLARERVGKFLEVAP